MRSNLRFKFSDQQLRLKSIETFNFRLNAATGLGKCECFRTNSIFTLKTREQQGSEIKMK